MCSECTKSLYLQSDTPSASLQDSACLKWKLNVAKKIVQALTQEIAHNEVEHLWCNIPCINGEYIFILGMSKFVALACACFSFNCTDCLDDCSGGTLPKCEHCLPYVVFTQEYKDLVELVVAIGQIDWAQ